MNLQKLYSYARKAVDEYQLIEEGDRIAVGVSGGKDSLTLLYALSGLARFYPKHFEVQAITVDLGQPGIDFGPVGELCRQLQVPYTVVSTQIYQIIFEARREENPCSLCAKMRKGAFNEQAKALGCNKVAYAHHRDDLVETLLLSLIFEGRIHTFSPKTYWDRMDLTLIRPLLFLPEEEIVGFARKYRLPVAKNPCPADGYTKRQYAKELLDSISRQYPGTKERMLTAILNGELPGWPARIRNPRMNARPDKTP